MRGERGAGAGGVAAAVSRVARVHEYRTLFQRAFGAAGITALTLSRALAAYERSLAVTDTPFDRYMRGDRSAMSDVERRGMEAFDSHGCTLCHSGPMFSDYKLHVLGVPDSAKLGGSDPGAEHRYAFRTPSLRNLASTAPYMHSGLIADLKGAVGFYKSVGGSATHDTPHAIDGRPGPGSPRSEEHTSELQSLRHLVCRLLLEKKK